MELIPQTYTLLRVQNDSIKLLIEYKVPYLANKKNQVVTLIYFFIIQNSQSIALILLKPNATRFDTFMPNRSEISIYKKYMPKLSVLSILVDNGTLMFQDLNFIPLN